MMTMRRTVIAFLLVGCGSPAVTQQNSYTDGGTSAGERPAVDLTCGTTQPVCTGLLRTGGSGSDTYTGPSGPCSPKLTLRGCKCLPLDSLWVDTADVTDQQTTWSFNAVPPIYPYHVADYALNGITNHWTIWNVYALTQGTANGTQTTVMGQRAAAEVSLDSFPDCQ